MKEVKLAGCVITDSENGVLLIHRKYPNQWELPGGKVEEGESEENAAKRELLEELEVKVGIIALIGGTEFYGTNTRFSYTWFRAEILGGEPRICEEKHDSYGYFQLNQQNQNGTRFSTNVYDLSMDIQSGRIEL